MRTRKRKNKKRMAKQQVPVTSHQKERTDRKSNWAKSFLWLGQGFLSFAKGFAWIAFSVVILYALYNGIINIDTFIELILALK